jgi:hypothetical protein
MLKLLISYDPIPEQHDAYFQYVLGEFVPSMERLGLTLCESWHTAYGEYPLRLNGFSAPDWDTMEQIISSADFKDLEDRLQNYVVNYDRRVVQQRGPFQY